MKETTLMRRKMTKKPRCYTRSYAHTFQNALNACSVFFQGYTANFYIKLDMKSNLQVQNENFDTESNFRFLKIVMDLEKFCVHWYCL